MTGSKLTYWYGKQEVSWKDQWAIAATAALAVALLVAAIITVWHHARKNHIAILRLHQLHVSYAGGATVQAESVRKTKEDVVVSVENERQAGTSQHVVSCSTYVHLSVVIADDYHTRLCISIVLNLLVDGGSAPLVI